MTTVSVVMPVRNGAATLARQLDALARQDFAGEWEVLVSDNGSTDATAEIARGFADRLPVRVIDSSARPGISFARNHAAAAADGDAYAFCDSDDVVDPSWVSMMAAACKAHDVVGGKLETETLNDAVARQWRLPIADSALPVTLGFLPYGVGANLAARASAFRALGGFDEAFRICGDDVDFCWRAQLQGMTIGFAPRAVVHYQLRSELRPAVRQQFEYGRAQALLFRRYRQHGAERPSRGSALRLAVHLATRTPNLLRGRSRRGVWLMVAGHEAGRVWGGMGERVAFWTL